LSAIEPNYGLPDKLRYRTLIKDDRDTGKKYAPKPKKAFYAE